MARTTKCKQKRAAGEDNTDNEPKPQAKKRKAETIRPRAPAKRGRKSGVETPVEQEGEAEGSGGFDESQGAENHIMGFEHQLLKVQSLKSKALRTNLVKFKGKVEEREGKTIADLELRRAKRKATKSEFLASVASILEDQAAIPQPADQTSSDVIFEALSSQHQSLKSASLHLLRTVAEYQSSIKQIMGRDLAIGESWNTEVLDVEEDIRSMAEKTAVSLERFFRSRKGGWRTVAAGWERRVAKLLKGAPVPECGGDEDGDH